MAEEEIEISELEFRETLSGDDLIPVETPTNTFATSLIVLKDWLLNYLVGKTGNETIGGVKTFLNKIHIPTPASNAENSEGANVEYVKNKILEIADKVGMVKGYAGITPPEGWLFCDGSAISRTTYSDLFADIGTTYGSGDGSTTFNLPNLLILGTSAPVVSNGQGITVSRADGLITNQYLVHGGAIGGDYTNNIIRGGANSNVQNAIYFGDSTGLRAALSAATQTARAIIKY